MAIKTLTAKIFAAIMALIIFASFAGRISVSANQSESDITEQELIDNVIKIFYNKASYEERYEQFCKLKNTTKTVSMDNGGGFYATDIKFYGRKIIDVDPNGNFILGPWEQLNIQTSVHGMVGKFSFDINGTYVAFAFSYDIAWGTNFPYSGVFWENIYYTDWKEIKIRLTGICRCAFTAIYLDDMRVFFEENSPSHEEWKPY
ncbi:MAG: hypothetical protein K6E47_17550 [Lachnospiraceae bacterium]|nr:hypothetical protein [Lachnospiraceae bacterium]